MKIENNIPTYIVNLARRTDRKDHVLNQFKGKIGFDVKIVKAYEHEVGSYGFWRTLCEILLIAKENRNEFVLICEDDHEFTPHYNFKLLCDSIRTANTLKADLLCGGVSWFNGALPATRNLYWTDAYNGNQFIVIYEKFYDVILGSTFYKHETTDFKLSMLASKKFFIFPFISIQKEFGYSDVTSANNAPEYVSKLFQDSSHAVITLKQVATFFHNNPTKPCNISFENTSVPTYIINLPERTDRRKSIINEFKDKPEFDLKIIDAIKHTIGAVGLWQTIRKIINLAIKNDENIIIICEDDHQFTNQYTKDFLFKNIFEAHIQGADYLSGGSGGIHQPIPISPSRFWGAECLSTQFIVIYRKFYSKILDEDFDDSVRADIMLSEITANKAVIYPFISIQKEFGYSDVTDLHNQRDDVVLRLFEKSESKLKRIRIAYDEYCPNE